jgi:two-component system NtrC family sensor kinase
MNHQEIQQSPDVPSGNRFFLNKTGWASGAAAFLLIGFVIYLLAVTYRSQQHVQKSAMIRLHENLVGLARGVDYFILERRNDMQKLAINNITEAYFTNKSLGMSMEYGLKGSLTHIATQFRQLNESFLLKTGAVYHRMALISVDGEILTEHADASPYSIQNFDKRVFSVTSPVMSVVSIDKVNPTFLLITAPVLQEKKIVGFIAGWVSLDTIYERLLNTRGPVETPVSGMTGRIILVSGKNGQVTGDRRNTIPVSDIQKMLEANNRSALKQQNQNDPWFFEWVDAGNKNTLIAVAAALEGVDIRLFHILDRQQIVDSFGPVSLLITLGLVSVTVIGFFFISIRYGIRAQVLAARLNEAGKKQAQIMQANENLAIEITQRQQAEKSLSREKNLLRSLIAAIPDLIFYKDLNSDYLGVNPAYEQFTGVKAADFIGKKSCDLFNEESTALNITQDQAVFKNRRTMQYEQWIYFPDGRQVLLETKKNPYYSDQGEIIGLIGVSRDITAHKKMELDLAEQHERLDLVIRGTNIGLWDWNVQTGETVFNERWADIVGYSLEEISPVSIKTWLNLLHPDDQNISNIQIEKHFSGEIEYYDCECRMRHKSGDWIWVHDRGKVVAWTKDGSPLRMLGTHADITYRKRAEEELRLAHDTLEQRVLERSRQIEKIHSQMVIQEKMASVGQLAAGIAHELNNPLNFVSLNFVTLTEYFENMIDVIQSYRNLSTHMETLLPVDPELEMIRAKEDEMDLNFILDDTPTLFKESRSGFDRIARIIKSMRDFSHVNHTGDFTMFNINTGIEDTLIIARNEYKYVADVTTELGDLPDIRCLPEQLNQVFLNLIVNSAQAIQTLSRQDRGHIMIRTWHDNKCIYCNITDDGPGIPADIQNRIFEPFFSTKPPGRGTGLGLSICYDIIVEKHRGNLTVHCPESGGTVFAVTIPNNL